MTNQNNYNPQDETQEHYHIEDHSEPIRVEPQAEIWGMPTRCPLEIARERGDIFDESFEF